MTDETDSYDLKLARSLASTRARVAERTRQQHYEKWLDQYLSDLNNIYRNSGIDEYCNFDDFCIFTYLSSDNQLDT